VDARQVNFPAMKNFEEGAGLADFILEGKLVPEPPTRFIKGEWVDKLMTQLNHVRNRCFRLHFKSIGGILALQEKIAAAWKERNVPVAAELVTADPAEVFVARVVTADVVDQAEVLAAEVVEAEPVRVAPVVEEALTAEVLPDDVAEAEEVLNAVVIDDGPPPVPPPVVPEPAQPMAWEVAAPEPPPPPPVESVHSLLGVPEPEPEPVPEPAPVAESPAPQADSWNLVQEFDPMPWKKPTPAVPAAPVPEAEIFDLDADVQPVAPKPAEVLDLDLDAGVVDAEVIDAEVIDAEVIDADVVEAEVLDAEPVAPKVVPPKVVAPVVPPPKPVTRTVPVIAPAAVTVPDVVLTLPTTTVKPATDKRPAVKVTIIRPGEKSPFPS
jgi:hypothetical protein